MRIIHLAAFVLGCHLLGSAGWSQTTFLEIKQDATAYNLRKTNGMPLSNIVTTNGSDGRLPGGVTSQAAGGTANPATANQFQSVVSFGGLVTPIAPGNLDTNLSYAKNAATIGLPRATSGGAVVLILKTSRVGAPFHSRAVSFQIGAIIPVPSVDETGVALTNTLPRDYWAAEPHTTNSHATAAYYWSKHAEVVFSIQPGPVSIVWKKAVPGVYLGTNRPPDYATNSATYFVDGPNYYKLYPVHHISSGSAVKIPQQIYWTEGVFRDSGKPVEVPAARVSAVNIVYNNNFPKTVAEAYVDVGQSLIAPATNTLQELRTLWYDNTRKQILAYNLQGRVFLELLGDARADGVSKQHLGFEIVDVIKQPNPTDITAELGERLSAYAGGHDEAGLFPEPILRPGVAQNFTYEAAVASSGARRFYAVRETVNQSDVLMHWLREGEQGLRWPARYVRYRQIWPADSAKYSHYVRPLVGTEAEAKLTAVPLPLTDIPEISYQDPFDTPRAKLTDNFAFYTFLSEAFPAHRTLLRFTSGNNFRFERVFSWLDENLTGTNFTNTVATNLTSVQTSLDYPTKVYPGLYQAYTNYPSARSRGVNGDWKLHVTGDTTNLAFLNTVVSSADGTKLVAVVAGGQIYTSADSGTTWTARESNRSWRSIASSADGTKLAAGECFPDTGQLYTSTDSGISWTAQAGAGSHNWACIASSADGTKLAAVDANPGKRIFTSTNSGVTWAEQTGAGSRLWGRIASSADGTKLAATEGFGPVYTSTDSGTNWTARAGSGSRVWVSIASSADGTKLAAVPGVFAPGLVYTSTDSGVTWTGQAASGSRLWQSITSSDDGTKLAAMVFDGQIYTSVDSGVTWTARESARQWFSIASSGDGTKLAAVTSGKGIVYTSTDSGVTWTERNVLRLGGEITAWDLLVITRSDTTGLLATNTFTQTGSPAIDIPLAGQAVPKPATITVSGITNAVTSVQVVFRGFSHSSPMDMDAFLVGPRSNVCAIVSDAGGGTPGVTNLTLVFSDDALGSAPQSLSFTNGSYEPTDYESSEALPAGGLGAIGTSLAALLLPPVPQAVEPPLTLAPWDLFSGPRVVRQTAYVGDRISNPIGESGTSDGGYLAGYILQSKGRSFNAAAYKDPFAAEGFEVANLGAIIPVNVIPGANALEVWWFRENSVDLAKGFKSIYWPAVIGHYTLQWPASPSEIVLASNDGSGGLGSLQAKGSIYGQNNPALPGYNPNEEHGLMLGGQAYALRDDLNLTGTTAPAVLTGGGVTYSSEPFVLVDYTESDGRPAMLAFKVLREKPGAGILFDYITEAGKLLQAPMPLPFLAPPVERITTTNGSVNTNYNAETAAYAGDLPVNWGLSSELTPAFAHYKRFTYRDRKEGFWVYRGLHSGIPSLETGTFNPSANAFQSLANASTVVNEPFVTHVHASRQLATLQMESLGALPPGLAIRGLTVTGTPTAAGTNIITLRISDQTDGSAVTNSLVLAISASGPVVSQGALTITSTNSFTGTVTTFVGRPPYLARSAATNNSFTMRFYYRTQAGFDWPGMTAPAEGTIVPYLRPYANGAFTGDAASKNTAAFDIVYRPTWPTSTPTLAPGQTLTAPTAGLPAVRGQSSVQVLYQQSIAANISILNRKPSVRLHDPTREKSYAFGGPTGFSKLPAGVRTESYQGKTYFPNLPPHLAQRLFFDPARGTAGHLVFKGEFQDEPLGEKYLLLNVLGGADLETVKGLCPGTDPNKVKWDAAVVGLAAKVETFYENPAIPGNFIPNPAVTNTVGVTNLVEVTDDDAAVDSYALSASGPGTGYVTLIAGNGVAFTPEAEPVSVHVIRVGGPLYLGEIKVMPSLNPLNELLTLQHTGDLAAQTSQYEYDWRIAPPVDGLALQVNEANPGMTGWNALTNAQDVPRYTLGGAGIQVLVDNYVTMRYRPKNLAHPLYNQWSVWTTPQLAEGWIKRVLAGINPFNQRINDLFNNTVNTDASILSQAGKRWEGDVALNLASINNYGLIEIYETVLRRGKSLSIDSGINFGPANDALLLAAGYLNDLYMMHGNEAFADAANPTIGIGSKNSTYGDIATSMFAFKGQVATLLHEELAMLRGRDEFLQPGTEVTPVYNRLIWNYTRGIDSGEVIYALNYNILDQDGNGSIGAADAAKLYPQGHGDAYGHYLTALKGYYGLLMDTDFDWVPRIEAVTVLGKPVSVDYQDERKFAAAASAVARTGRQIFDLTWREDYKSGKGNGWENFAATRSSTTRTRYWGLDHWASRTGEGAYLNWIVGNAILPDVDPDPAHEGIQKVDRTTVPELQELPSVAAALQTSLDNAEAGLTPLGLPETSIPFDLDPNAVVGTAPQTHFEQVNNRAKATLRNALVAFDEAKDVTRLMRSEGDSLKELQNSVSMQELAYTNSLIELYGTPYPEDIGPGKTYPAGYAGPDFLHYAYVDDVRLQQLKAQDTGAGFDFQINALMPAGKYLNEQRTRMPGNAVSDNAYFVHLDSTGFYSKPGSYVGRRTAPGQLQEAIANLVGAHNATRTALEDNRRSQYLLTRALEIFAAKNGKDETFADVNKAIAGTLTGVEALVFAAKMSALAYEIFYGGVESARDIALAAIPDFTIVGLANGGSITAPAQAAVWASFALAKAGKDGYTFGTEFLVGASELVVNSSLRNIEANVFGPLRVAEEDRARVYELEKQLEDLRMTVFVVNQRFQELDNAHKSYQSLVAKGDRILAERETFRQRSAAVVQGFRTRDAAFRIFRSEKLERYKTLFDLAARYAFMSAQAYDYETGQLGSTAGRDFISRIIRARALGVMKDGEPQYAGSNAGDPGLSSALAEMAADWLVLKGRLGFNNPDAYGTTVSLRTENHRILPTADGDTNWKDVLQRGRVANLLDDADVKRQCLQIDPGNGLPVPGIILEFTTTIADGYNLFGKPLAAGDHNYNPSSFATKIFAAGVAMEGYLGMDSPAANSSAVSGSGGTSPSDPTLSFLVPKALAATPYIYLLPVGLDGMRSPPLGDASLVRTWSVDDVIIPLPFNLGASDFSTKQLWQSSDSLTEPLFGVRKHQAFRPVSSASLFENNIYTSSGGLQRSQYTSSRLIGRSVWNSKWKIVIPGHTLLNDPNEGLDRFIQTVKDIKINYVTYSFSGN